MEQTEKKKTNVIVMIIIILIVIIITSLTTIKLLNDNIGKPGQEKENEVEATTKNISHLDDFTIMIKDYFYENNYVSDDNLASWNINTITYVGKLKDQLYYKVEGTFSCLDLTGTCLYLPQLDEPEEGNTNVIYPYIFYVITEKNNDKETIIRLESFVEELPSDIISSNETLKSDEKQIKDFQEKLEKYYKDNNLIDTNNLDSLVITSIEYAKTTNEGTIYEIKGSYKCKDNSADCFYVVQTNEPQNNKYDFDLYLLIKDNNIINIDTIMAEESISSIFNPEPMKDTIVNIVKDYYKKKGFANGVATWDIDKVTLVGYYDTTMNDKIYFLEGTYTCTDGESDCVYLEQVGDKLSNNKYPFQIYATLDSTKTNYEVKTLSGSITNENLINVNKNVR